MAGFGGYTGRSLDLLRREGVGVGDTVRIRAELTHTGIIMPRYEHADDGHIVIKLESGYNVGVRLEGIDGIERVGGDTDTAEEGGVPDGGGAGRPGTGGKGGGRNPGLPDILLLSTGGTIASSIDYRTGAVTPTLSAQQLNDSIPELSGIANIEARVLFSEYSENVVPDHWLKIAGAVRDAAASPAGYAGIIIAHGTDTMHYTSSFLSFALSGLPVPVALTGSQRSPDRASSDAAQNLIGAARLVAGCKTNGIYVVMHRDENDGMIAGHAGTRVRKNHTSKRGAFQTVGGEPAFLLEDDGGAVRKNTETEFFTGRRFDPRIVLDRRVALVKYHPGMSPESLRAQVGSGCRAVIFEGTGLGHVGRTMYPAVKEAARAGIFMGMTSQCIEGRVSMTVYESGRDLLAMGITPLGDMIPETALVKAMWAAGIAEDRDGITEIMTGRVASEFSV